MADAKKPGTKPGASKVPAAGARDYRDIETWILIILVVIFLAGSYGSLAFGVESLFSSPFWQYLFLWIKIIAGTLSLVFAVGIVYVLMRLATFRKKEPRVQTPTEPAGQTGGLYSYEWTQVTSGLENASDADAALLIIEADSLVDRILKDMKLPGETMGERLQALGEQRFESIDDLWEAHKLRNQIAHEGAKGITYGDAVWAIERYERALKKLGVI